MYNTIRILVYYNTYTCILVYTYTYEYNVILYMCIVQYRRRLSRKREEARGALERGATKKRGETASSKREREGKAREERETADERDR